MLSYTRPISINAMLRRPVESAQLAWDALPSHPSELANSSSIDLAGHTRHLSNGLCPLGESPTSQNLLGLEHPLT